MRKSDESSDEEFRSFGRFDPFEAERLLSRFQETGIRMGEARWPSIGRNNGWAAAQREQDQLLAPARAAAARQFFADQAEAC